MIQERFGENGQIYFEIVLITSDGLSHEIREILLGSQWLKIFMLTADYSENIVTLF